MPNPRTGAEVESARETPKIEGAKDVDAAARARGIRPDMIDRVGAKAAGGIDPSRARTRGARPVEMKSRVLAAVAVELEVGHFETFRRSTFSARLGLLPTGTLGHGSSKDGSKTWLLRPAPL